MRKGETRIAYCEQEGRSKEEMSEQDQEVNITRESEEARSN